MYIYIYIYVYMYIYVHVYTHTYLNINTHTRQIITKESLMFWYHTDKDSAPEDVLALKKVNGVRREEGSIRPYTFVISGKVSLRIYLYAFLYICIMFLYTCIYLYLLIYICTHTCTCTHVREGLFTTLYLCHFWQSLHT